MLPIPEEKFEKINIENLHNILKTISSYKIPTYLINKLDSVNDLGIAFQRINKQGIPMSNAELFFSGIKLVWPEAHDLVWEIYGDDTGENIKSYKNCSQMLPDWQFQKQLQKNKMI